MPLASGKIRGLIFNHDNLSGSIPLELSGSLHLKELDFSPNPKVTESIPYELGLLKQATDIFASS